MNTQTVPDFLGRRWQVSQASGAETVRKGYGEATRAQDPAASGVRRVLEPGSARLKAAPPRGPGDE